jgi:hypothetical protein
MQVKDYLQALSDEGRIRVEKIGSGNWYWSFAGEEKKKKQDVLDGLRADKAKVDASARELEEKIEEAGRIRGGMKQGEGSERQGLLEKREILMREVEGLKKELMGYSENDPEEIARRSEEVEWYKLAAERWTDNIYVLEGYLSTLTGGDREALEQIRLLYYGSEYVEGEGLREL